MKLDAPEDLKVGDIVIPTYRSISCYNTDYDCCKIFSFHDDHFAMISAECKQISAEYPRNIVKVLNFSIGEELYVSKVALKKYGS